MTKGKGCYLTLSQDVGNEIKFYLDDDGKIHRGKIVKIFVTMYLDETVEAEYEVKARFHGKQEYVRIKGKDIVG